MSTKEVKLQFDNASSLYPNERTFYFQNPISSFFGGERGNVEVTRSINKNLIQSPLPVEEYDEGGLCVDIGMCDDTFSITMETYSWAEYRLLAALVKENTGLRSGVFTYGADSFIVAVRNCSFTNSPGQGDYFKISIALTVVNSRFAV